jgi:hypothetical protein
MQINDETMAILWIGAGAVILWRLLPAVLNALGLTLLRISMDDDAGALEPTGDDAGYQKLFNQLRSVGFEPVGTRRKACWFFLHHWRKDFQARVFEARQGDCVAVTYKLRSWDPWRLCFMTAFDDGSIVETANQMESFRIDEPDHLRWGLATPDRALLLERHRETCQQFAAAGSRNVARLPVEMVNRLNVLHESRFHRQRHRWTGLKSASNSLWFLAIALLLVRELAATELYLVPVTIIAWGFLWRVVHAFLFRSAAGRFRADDAARQRRQPMPPHSEGAAIQRS